MDFPQFLIDFRFNDLSYTAEVKGFSFHGTMIYDVYVNLEPITGPAILVQVYPGSGSLPGIYWRQRASTPDTTLEDPDFIQAIGEAIENWKV